MSIKFLFHNQVNFLTVVLIFLIFLLKFSISRSSAPQYSGRGLAMVIERWHVDPIPSFTQSLTTASVLQVLQFPGVAGGEAAPAHVYAERE